jgi:hypothetical protein
MLNKQLRRPDSLVHQSLAGGPLTSDPLVTAGHPHHEIINRLPSPAGRLVIAQAVACSCEVRAGRIGSTSPIPINKITHANATAHTAFGCRNGLAG